MNTTYNPNAWQVVRFYQHARFALAEEIERNGHGKNRIEKLGDLGLWTIENFPGKVWRLLNEPRFVTVFLAKISLVANTYLFYPQFTKELASSLIGHIALPSREQLKFALYITISAHIIFAALRAYGRLSNEELYNDWLANKKPAAVV